MPTGIDQQIVVSFSNLPVFLPTILKKNGLTAIYPKSLVHRSLSFRFPSGLVQSGSTTEPANMGSMVLLLSLLGEVEYILLAASKKATVRYLGVFLAAAGVFPAISNIFQRTLNNQGSSSKRGAAIILLNMIGQ
ncbi:hypothetical protein DL768_008181 [Monosporascus sp. mg162]|nr:hypothetical protein DL768_008181 [Monosporascus sp. mg162]